jgi:eukaryotic-like serine/threonine-protein kinase
LTVHSIRPGFYLEQPLRPLLHMLFETGMNPERWRQISHLCDAALACDEGERAAFLRDACAGDLALRREVEALLAQQESGFLEAPAVDAAAPTVSDAGGSILTGRRLGAYQVHERIGVGGMGEVYRARDTKLGRDVAIKILPRQFTTDPDRMARFEREARVLASLNHPHIGAIYGLEDADGGRALVLELVDGETLEERIAHGPIPLTDTLTIARQITDALDDAHEKGIVHRDLKPANIKITPDGVVKVLDFGLARIVSTRAGSTSDSRLPTITIEETREGLVMGTAAYMSPEQARGQTIDKRTDIWAFGCVVYEMLTGTRAIPGRGLTETIAAIVRDDPDWSRLPPGTPAAIRQLLNRCLQKDHRQRLRDIGDARIEIAEGLSKQVTAATAQEGSSAPGPSRGAFIVLASIAFFAIIVAAAALALWSRSGAVVLVPAGAPPQMVTTQLTNYGGTEASPALSPDGRSFVFVSDHGGTPDIWLRQVSGGEPVRLTNDEVSESDLAFAPDGERIYYARIGTNQPSIWQVGVLGGEARKVIEGGRRPAISRDGRNLAYLSQDSNGSGPSIRVMELGGGSARTLVPKIHLGRLPRPAWSPDGRQLAYSANELFGPLLVFVVDVETGQQRQVSHLPTGSNDSGQPVWLPDNRHLVVSYLTSSRVLAPVELGLVDIQDGSIARLTTTVADGFLEPSVSADGSRLIATSIRSLREVWKVPLGPDPDANGRAAVRLLDGSTDPMWTFVSRDGRTLLFNSPAAGSRNLWTMPVDRSAPPRQITTVPGDAVTHSSLSPDGTHVAFVSIASGNSDIWTQNIDGSDLRQLTNDENADNWPVWSPDGQWIAYRTEVRGIPDVRRVRASGGASEPFPDGPSRGDWIRQLEGIGSWSVSGSPEAVAIRLVNIERHAVIWLQTIREALTGNGQPAGIALPMFSPDGRSISAPFQESRDHDAIRLFDVATGESRVAVRLPFHVQFRASWVEGGKALVVNRSEPIRHIVLFDRFWGGELENKP